MSQMRIKRIARRTKGFSGGKALAGAVLTGGIGLLAGTIGSKDVNITCLKCGNRFKAGEAITVKKGRAGNDLDNRLCALLHEGKYVQAMKLYQDETNENLTNTATYIRGIAEKENIDLKKNDNSGCASVIVVFVIVASAIAFMI